jgi:hypothetical protein
MDVTPPGSVAGLAQTILLGSDFCAAESLATVTMAPHLPPQIESFLIYQHACDIRFDE